MSAHDAFCTLPDCLLSFILSKMPIKDAVKSSILSKRWRFLYTQMPELTFSPYHFAFQIIQSIGIEMPELTSKDPLVMSRVENIISNMLLRHSGDLQGFHVHSVRLHFSPENVCKWVEYASQHNVQHLTLFDCTTFPRHLEEIPALFSCSRLVTLRLDNYILTSFPIDFVGFPLLISCYLCGVRLTDESLASLVSLCPLLQKLEMRRCDGLGHGVICSSSIEHLHMNFLYGVESVLVNCPKLKILTGFMIADLIVNGTLFYELSYAVSYLKMHCGGTLRELELEFLPECSQKFPARRFLDILGNFQSLKKLIIYLRHPLEREANMGFPLWNLFHRLPNLEMFFMLGLFVQEMAKDPIPDCLSPPHLNLKNIQIEILEFDHKEVGIISCLLQSTPSLEALEIQPPDEDDKLVFDGYDKGQCLKLWKEVRYLRRASFLARIIILDTYSNPIQEFG